MTIAAYRCAISLLALGAVVDLSETSPAVAGPWPQAEGHGFVIETLSYTSRTNHAGVPNPAFGNGTFRRLDIGPYVEYGLTDSLTLGGYGTFQSRELDRGTSSLSTVGVGDIEVFARNVLWRDNNWIITGQGLIKFPTGYKTNTNPALGNGQVDAEPKLMIGRGFSLGDWPSFADLQAGYRVRFGSPADQVRIDAELGTHPVEDWMFLLQGYSITSVQNQPIGATDFDLYTLVGSVVHHLSKEWSVQVGGFTEAASRNYNRGSGGFAAIWFKF